MLKKRTERVRVIGSSDPAAFMSRSFNCPSETRSISAMHGRPPSFSRSHPGPGNKEMDQKRGLLLRAMPPITDEGSRIRPIASTYNVMITLVYPFLVVQQTVAPPTRKGRNMETSLPFRSENLWRKSGFKFPETTRLYSQREYAAPKIIPSAANVATKLFLWKAPTKIGNSPIKLLVPGKLILAKVEEKEMVERFGMVLTEPP